ncbi:MAG: hypothetical protein BRC26_03435 [Nanohaloarchaea archaeon QH_8_44_6]|nr:MAG: hypothetical protein BRC26_03435 [Nanohaloarchaea archaeon QH_8_44_6]
MSLHKNLTSFENFEAIGFGGGQTPFGTPYEPSGEEIKNTLNQLYERFQSDTRIAVIHQPPENTELDKVDEDHVGSPEVRELIEDHDFDLVLTGHIHEARGEDTIGNTKLVNPGPVTEGFYATTEIDQDSVEVELKSL